MECTHESFFSAEYSLALKCTTAKTMCEQEYINYYSLTYCNMNGYWYFILPAVFALILLDFRLIQITVHHYLAPSLQFLTEAFNLPEAVAAVTLLALANGAGDVITALASAGSADAMEYAIGSLYGAAFFGITVVASLIFYKKEIQINKINTYMDIIFFIITTLIVIFQGFRGDFIMTDSIVFFALYLLYVASVVINDKYIKPRQQSSVVICSSQIQEVELTQELSLQKQNSSVMETTTDTANDSELQDSPKKEPTPPEETDLHHKPDKTFIHQFITVPILFVMQFFIPPSKPKSKLYLLTITPSLCLSMLILTGQLNYLIWLQIYLPVILAINILLYFWNWNYILIEFVTVISSIVLTYLFSGILIDLLSFVGMLTNLSSIYLALTIIALGTAIPDVIVTLSLIKSGYSLMALSGIYAGQIFGIQIGLGLSIFKQTLSVSKVDFVIQTNMVLIYIIKIMMILISATLAILVITIIYGCAKKYQYGKHISYFFISSYLATFGILTTIALYNALK